MSAPVPKGRWSWKYNKCVKCGTKTIKHRGKGFCTACYERKRLKNSEIKKRKKAYHDKWYSKIKGTKKRIEYCKLKSKEWVLDENSGYKLYLRRTALRGRFKRFINRKEILKRDLGGIKFRCNGCSKNCLITSPIKELKKHKMYEFDLFKEVLIKTCKKKLMLKKCQN